MYIHIETERRREIKNIQCSPIVQENVKNTPIAFIFLIHLMFVTAMTPVPRMLLIANNQATNRNNVVRNWACEI